jgi:hypothetical protein
MSRYSEVMHPEIAAMDCGRVPGNYIIHFDDGSVYCGRQARSTNRIRAHLNKWGREVIAVQFMRDHSDDECVRADRERSTIEGFLERRIPLRNRIQAAIPISCAAADRW